MNISVSIIEDDAQTRRILAEWVRSAEGFTLLGEHESAENALSTIPKENPMVVLSDINLPGMSGVECVRHLKAVLPQTQFVMLTVYRDEDHIFEALSAGATGYLLKQTPRRELIAALKQVHGGGSPMTSTIARKVVESFERFSHPSTADLVTLTPRELEILHLLAHGHLYKEIAETLAVSLPTVATHIRHIYEKLHVRSRSQAVAKYSSVPMQPARAPASGSRAGTVVGVKPY
ncbi:MAG: response regulator transcription factor [Verrucomicrobiota bacterium]